MGIYRHSQSPYWHYDFQLRGRRYSGSTGLEGKRAAEQFVAKLRTEAAMGIVSKRPITLDEAFGLWWKSKGEHQRNADTTWGQQRRLLKALGASTLMSSVTLGRLADYVTKRRAAVSNATVNREVELYRRVWRFIHALDEFEIGKEFAWRKLLLPEPKERVRELSPDEEARLMAVLNTDLGAMVEFAELSGQRKTAIVGLLWSNVDLDNKTARFKIKAEADGWHTIPLTPRMIEIIQSRPKICPQVFTYECKRSAPPIRRGDKTLPGRRKGVRYPFSKQGWTREWRAALKAAGIEDFRFHDLRHTAGSRITRACGNLKVTQRVLGHTSIMTTARYAHASDDDIRRAMGAAESRNSPELEAEENGERLAKTVRKA
jgi:integrase